MAVNKAIKRSNTIFKQNFAGNHTPCFYFERRRRHDRGTTFSVLKKKIMEKNKDKGKTAAGSANPENDPSRAMDSKKEVEQSRDKKTDQDFPGYPHYPAREDIMDQRAGTQQVDMDVENIASSRNTAGASQRFARKQEGIQSEGVEKRPSEEEALGLDLQPGNEGDVTSDDLEVLNATNEEIGTPQNVSQEDINTDLDIPGSELDDDNEAIGEEDEENNYYSLGGDLHESQEEDPYSGPKRGNTE